MPGLIIVSRRWNIGSDDIIIPASFYLFLHLLWIILYMIVCIKNSTIFLNNDCELIIILPIFGQFILLSSFIIIELFMIKLSLRGSILNTGKRSSLNTLIYIWFALFIIDILWEIYGLIIMINYSIDHIHQQPLQQQSVNECKSTNNLIIGLKIYLLFIWITFLLFIWCAFDYAGKSWYKMKRFQQSLNNTNAKYKYRRSNNSFHRNWRYREAVRKYQQSWLNRCRWFFCVKDRRDNSFAEIAKLLSEFFRDLDVVPSDVIAGLSLMRIQQKCQRKQRILMSNCSSSGIDENEKIYQFLSGVAITAETKFLDLTHVLVIREIYNLIHYLHYSLAIYGWPMFMVSNPPSKWFQLLKHIKCCGNRTSIWSNCICCISRKSCCIDQHIDSDTIVDLNGSTNESTNSNHDTNNFNDIIGDNCCLCNRAAIRQTCIEHDYKIIYITYHVDIEKPPFFVAIDYDKMSIVISIRGTLSVSDVITDLNAEYDLLPLNQPRDNWYGHKGMVAAAAYIKSCLIKKHLIEIANEHLKIRNLATDSHHQYPIIIVGHSLGAGTAAILTVLLREIYANVICFAFAPPGGLFSLDLAEYSKDFVISIVLGKDIIPRLGLHQMEKLRFDLIKVIKNCEMSKWPIIFKSLRIGGNDISNDDYIKEFKMNSSSVTDSCTKNNSSSFQCVNGNGDGKIDSQTDTMDSYQKRQQNYLSINENIATHPNDENIQLTVHKPLYPPGSIIHLVRVHPNKSDYRYESTSWRRIIGQKKSYIIHQALWAGNSDFNEILISPSMISDHMPDNILDALQSLLINTGPPKPKRNNNNNNFNSLNLPESCDNNNYDNDQDQDQFDGKKQRFSSFDNHIYQQPPQSNIKSQKYSDHKMVMETSFAWAMPATSMTTKRSKRNPKVPPLNEYQYNEEHLRRLRSLISKRKAPLATPETISLNDFDVIDHKNDEQQQISMISNNSFNINIQQSPGTHNHHYDQQIIDNSMSQIQVV